MMKKNHTFDDLKKELDGESDNDNRAYDKWLVYDTGETKTVDFQMLDGGRQHFNYGHYIKAWMGIEDSAPFIKVFFSTDTISIKGFCLDKLYDHFRKLDVIVVRANNQRYHNTMTIDENEPFVTDITIEAHKTKSDN